MLEQVQPFSCVRHGVVYYMDQPLSICPPYPTVGRLYIPLIAQCPSPHSPRLLNTATMPFMLEPEPPSSWATNSQSQMDASQLFPSTISEKGVKRIEASCAVHPDEEIAAMSYRSDPPCGVTFLWDGRTVVTDAQGQRRPFTIATNLAGEPTDLYQADGERVSPASIAAYESTQGLTRRMWRTERVAARRAERAVSAHL